MRGALLRLGVACAALLLALSTSLPAAARDANGPGDSLWMPIGLNVGYSMNPAPLSNGLLLGPELSLVYFDQDAYWLGAYTEALRDFGAEEWRVGGGLEGGFANFGLDVGYQGILGRDGGHALRSRLIFSMVLVQIYGGVGARLLEPKAPVYGELGLLLKFPFELGKLD